MPRKQPPTLRPIIRPNYEEDEVKKAYLKLKTHIYYDTTELFQRRQLAIFETGLDEDNIFRFPSMYRYNTNLFESFEPSLFEKKFESIAKAINDYHKDGEEFFKSLFKEISYFALPKKISNPNSEQPKNFITNKRENNKYEVERVTVFIDCPIELHIVSVMWMIKYGYKLDAKLDEGCLGNRLILNKDKTGIVEGTALFKPYFSQYQKWRDDAIDEAKRRLDRQETVALVNLDIKDYFYSVRINFEKIEKEAGISKYDNLHAIFKEIHAIYSNLLGNKKIPHSNIEDELDGNSLLPIGLASSYVLANWYLKEFDDRVINKIRPVYFSRYVDDILIVIPKPNFEYNQSEDCEKLKFDFDNYVVKEDEETISFEELDNVEVFILETFYPILKIVDYPEWLKTGKQDEVKILKITCTPDCYIQSDKTLLYYFDPSESTVAIDKLKQELEERASEFRDFPESQELDKSFDEQAYHLIFDGSEGKIRTLKDYKENRYGLSIFLANRIFSALRKVKKTDEKESEKLLKLFKGLNALEYYRLWEKIFTYFIVNDDKKGFIDFYKNTHSTIEKINYKGNHKEFGIKTIEVINSLYRYFDIAVELAFALNPMFLKKKSEGAIEFEILQNKLKQDFWGISTDELTSPESWYIPRFRRSNMIRHNYVAHPLLNYTNAARGEELNLISRNLPKNIKDNKLEWSKHSLAHSPRMVKFWECCIAVATKHILSEDIVKKGSDRDERYFYTNLLGNHNPSELIPGDDFYLEEAFRLYYLINSIHFPKETLKYEERRQMFFELHKKDINSSITGVKLYVNEFKINKNNSFGSKPKISFANIELSYSCFLASLRGEPVLKEERYQTFAKLLKSSRKAGANLFLLPECSVPYELLSSFAKYAEKSQILMVLGMEHWNSHDISFNFIVTILPVEVNGVRDAVVVYRLKNHYSHHEEADVRGNGYLVPKPVKHRYDLFNWKGLYFSPYYCVELGDIFQRSLFKSKVDLIVASEWNQDTNYFSNIVESLSRDLHAYVAQVNTSDYGDSRLTQPTKTERKDILKLKGGINSTILVGEIDLGTLREFQRKHYELTKDDKIFKPLPPDFDRKAVLKRIKGEFQFPVDEVKTEEE